MSKQLSILWLAVVSGAALAQERPAPTPAAQEIKRTMEAFVGRWTGSTSATVPGEQVERFAFTLQCDPAAMGTGASCVQEGKASFGPVAESCLIGYDPDGSAVHKMCIGSVGEVSDYKGHWTDRQTIEFDPTRGTMDGKPTTEIITLTFPDSQSMTGKSVVALPDGSKVLSEFTARRAAAPAPVAPVAAPLGEHVVCITDSDCPASAECWPTEHSCRLKDHTACSSDKECPSGLECDIVGPMAIAGNDHACKPKPTP